MILASLWYRDVRHTANRRCWPLSLQAIAATFFWIGVLLLLLCRSLLARRPQFNVWYIAPIGDALGCKGSFSIRVQSMYWHSQAFGSGVVFDSAVTISSAAREAMGSMNVEVATGTGSDNSWASSFRASTHFWFLFRTASAEISSFGSSGPKRSPFGSAFEGTTLASSGAPPSSSPAPASAGGLPSGRHSTALLEDYLLEALLRLPLVHPPVPLDSVGHFGTGIVAMNAHVSSLWHPEVSSHLERTTNVSWHRESWRLTWLLMRFIVSRQVWQSLR